MKMGVAKLGAGIAVIAGAVGIARPAAADLPLQEVQYANGKNGNFCLDTSNHGVANGTNVVVHTCQNYNSQFWATDVNNPLNTYYGTYYMERNDANSNKCLGILGNSLSNGAHAVVWDCFPFSQWGYHQDQYWLMQHAPYPQDGCYIFWNASAGMVLGVSGGNVFDGAQVIQWPMPANGPFNPDQLWCPARGT
jgi:hypothetical protein